MFRSIHMLLITAAGLLASVLFWDAGLGWWSVAVVVYFGFSCLGVTVTFHRFVTHKSFNFRWEFLEKFFILLGTLAGTGSAVGWAAVHIEHHAHSDTEEDPHGPHQGWRHFVPDYDNHVNYMKVRRLLADPYIRWLHNYNMYVIVVYWAVLFMLGGVQLLAFAGLIPQAFTSVFSVLCNYFPHKTGYRNFEIEDKSYNTWWLALPTWGDSWHNNHHAKPYLSSFQHNWWEIDISGMVIRLIKKN